MVTARTRVVGTGLLISLGVWLIVVTTLRGVGYRYELPPAAGRSGR